MRTYFFILQIWGSKKITTKSSQTAFSGPLHPKKGNQRKFCIQTAIFYIPWKTKVKSFPEIILPGQKRFLCLTSKYLATHNG